MPRKNCAYCGENCEPTREHIFAESLLERARGYDARFVPQAEKFVKADPVVKDVCHHCNNVLLAEVDGYFAALYDRYFAKFPERDELVEFEYDFTMLGRGLLKILYNSARSHRGVPPDGVDDLDLLRGFVPFVLKGESLPQPGFYIMLLRIAPTANETGLHHHMAFRSGGIVPRQGRRFSWAVCRHVAINSYYFLLVFPTNPPETRMEIEEDIRYLGKMYPGIALVPESDSRLVVATSSLDAASMLRPFFLKHGESMNQFNRDNEIDSFGSVESHPSVGRGLG